METDELREQVDRLREAWLEYGYDDDRTIRLFNGLMEIRGEEQAKEEDT